MLRGKSLVYGTQIWFPKCKSLSLRTSSTNKVRSNVSMMRSNHTADLIHLKQQSKLHLVDEYKFYIAAVKQFQKQVSSIIDPSLLSGCIIVT
jgi:hypothetical protein